MSKPLLSIIRNSRHPTTKGECQRNISRSCELTAGDGQHCAAYSNTRTYGYARTHTASGAWNCDGAARPSAHTLEACSVRRRRLRASMQQHQRITCAYCWGTTILEMYTGLTLPSPHAAATTQDRRFCLTNPLALLGVRHPLSLTAVDRECLSCMRAGTVVAIQAVQRR